VAKRLVVFDTNIFLRALINPKGINARLVASLDRFVLVSSPSILEEVAEVLSRPELLIAKSIRKLDAERIVSLLRQSPMISPTVKVAVCRDPDDNKFLEAAIAAKATYVVTGDKDLRAIGEYEGVKIRYPAEFLRAIDEG
jgi:putative PIN family toxin of toxin-antitoxin system